MNIDLSSNTPFFVFALWALIVMFVMYKNLRPSAQILRRYGKPLAHFASKECWHSIPVNKGNTVFMDIYPEFVVVSKGKKEFVFDRSFNDFEFLGSYLTLVFEINAPDFKIQMTLTRKQKKMLQDFLGEY